MCRSSTTSGRCAGRTTAGPGVSPVDWACEPGGAGNLGLDLARSVIIAGLGPDMPVVLDYRLSLESPRVLYLGGDRPRWVEVASDVGDLLTRLGLRGPEAGSGAR